MVSSPCTKICKLDSKKEICTSCGRTLYEIVNWEKMNTHDRTIITKMAEGRINGDKE